MNYLLSCTACGNKIPVSTGQAGQTIHCQCGAEVEVPSIRELRNLEVAENAPVAAPAWGRRQGLIFLGGAIAALAFAGVAVLQMLKPTLVDVRANLDNVDPVAVSDDIRLLPPDENYMRYESVKPWPPKLFEERFKADEIPFYMVPSANLLVRFEGKGIQFLASTRIVDPILHKIQALNTQNMQAQVKRYHLGEWMLILGVGGGVGVAIAIAGVLMPSGGPRGPRTRKSMQPAGNTVSRK